MISLDRVRSVADAVLYEGYLLYPYRSTSAKNQVRWQFGVLGPPSAWARGLGEEPDLEVQCLLTPAPASEPALGGAPTLRVYLRFLQLQARRVEQVTGPGSGFVPVAQLHADGRTWLSWDEAVERELVLGPFRPVAGMAEERVVEVAGGEDAELIQAGGELIGRVRRCREPLRAVVTLTAQPVPEPGDGLLRLSIGVRNVASGPIDAIADRDAATARSFLGTHLILAGERVAFVSVIDPPAPAVPAAAGCVQRRCWPVLAGEQACGDAAISPIVLASPIILYDYPAVAPESSGALFDSTEIDEILTLRVMTLTDEEKAAARATDPQAAAIIDRCDQLTPAQLQRLHGVRRDPHLADPHLADPQLAHGPPTVPASDTEVPWWDPGADASVEPDTDAVLIRGVPVRRGSRVRLRPNRRADAQDLFFAGQEARVTAVLGDVDGGTHVAVVLTDDPAADLHESYGRYLYFAPDELEPLKEDRS